jgi:hypothetical protein
VSSEAFITRKALAPDGSPREGTPAPIPTAIHATAPSGPATPSEARETRPVYAFYTPTLPGDRFTPPFHGMVSLACATGHHRICRDHPTRLCGCRCHDPIVNASAPVCAESGRLALESGRLDLRPHARSATGSRMSTDPTPPRRRTGPKPIPWQERFWRYLTPGAPDDCWEWQGSRDARGYGRLNRGGAKNGTHIKAHRAAYELQHGPFDPELDVCHRCDNPPCCNPAHLFLGDARTNARDMASKGRAPAQRGHSNGREKLSAEAVRAIRQRAAAGARHTDLAAEFQLRGQYIAALVYGQRRRRAGGPIKEPPR